MYRSPRRWRFSFVLGWAILAAVAAGVAADRPAEQHPPEQNATSKEATASDDEPSPNSGSTPLLDGLGERSGDEKDRPLFNRISDEERVRVRDFLAEHFPVLSTELRELERRNPRLFQRRLRQIVPRIVRLMQEMEKDEELGLLGIEEEQLEFEIRLKVRAFLDANDEDVQRDLRTGIEGLIARQFDIRQQRSERMIQKLEHRLDHLKRQAERRAANREKLISRDVELRLAQPAEGQEDRPARAGHRPRG